MRAARELRVVRDHDDRRAHLVDLLEQVHDLAGHQRVHVAGRLVREQEARVAGERAGDRGALLLAAGELRGHVVHARGQADDLERALDALLAVLLGEAAVAQRHVHVVEDVEVRDQVEALEDEADLLVPQLRARLVREAADVLAVQLVGAGVEGLEQARDVHERRLAGARGTRDRDELAVADLQREVTQRVRLDQVRPVDLADSVHFEHWLVAPGS